MSLAATDLNTLVDVDTIIEIDEAIPCQIESVAGNVEECSNPVSFLVTFKTICDHHGNLPGGDPLVCGVHASWLAGGKYVCGGCQCRVEETPNGWHHLIIAFTEA